MRVARVLVDSPLPQLDRLFDYRIPATMEGVEPGVRVTVPLRSAGRTIAGFVVEVGEQEEYPGPISDIDTLVSTVPVLRPEVWQIARAVSRRAAGGANDVLRLAIPKRQVRVENSWLARDRASEAEPDVVEAPIDGFADDTLARVVRERGRAAVSAIPGVVRLPDGTWVGRWAVTLAQAARVAVASGGSAILAVPDYRDQDQLEAALRDTVPEGIVIRWDARQPNPARYRGLLRAADDAPRVVIGTRSVVYAPAARLALIAIWDDGDPLHAEPLAPYVHARDAALVRREQQASALLLVGHTRTTEAQRLVDGGWFLDVQPQTRPRPRVVPTANLLGGDRLAEQARIPSSAWREAKTAIADGPVLVQVARPGFAPGLSCAECGQAARCRRCAGPLLQRRAGAVPSCSWCGVPDAAWRCGNCDGTRLRPRGSGSARTAVDLGKAFPGVRVIVADGEHPVTEVSEKPALVVATRGAEPTAAGGYRAVLLLDGDRMVARENLRVGEDCLRWWSNAAALAADGAPTVLVGVGGALASTLTTWRHADYARAELADRRGLRFPPAVRVATLTGTADAVARAARVVTESAGEGGHGAVDVWGPTDVEGGVRAILRFDYAVGAQLADELRAEIIRESTAKRTRTPGAPPRARPVTLRAHLDDPEPFLE